MLCATKFQLSAVGSSFFLGNFIGSFILPRLGDIYGRKPLFQIGLSLQLVSYFGLFVASQKSVLYALLILGGISKAGSNDVGYIYATEIMPLRHRNLTGLNSFIVFALLKVCVCAYFWLSATKNWKAPALAATFMSIASLMSSFFLKESPRFLIGKKRF